MRFRRNPRYAYGDNDREIPPPTIAELRTDGHSELEYLSLLLGFRTLAWTRRVAGIGSATWLSCDAGRSATNICAWCCAGRAWLLLSITRRCRFVGS
ncbi:hypothetical protein [Methylobacterium nodulans]|uniref:Uncharacterized protein n=1 Tax=Methylobacterium nodulans (strain LMG 21967 / CNCM I-2342 / ORS 2060) TaxID=460265 RepID=B8IKZ5_METNO|nr:hypothetical protein [Methylobacterium nodulans]ACL58183.1 hypothetical protein Mnod_3260 [Methylobacterium nodulans ORS 2060]